MRCLVKVGVNWLWIVAAPVKTVRIGMMNGTERIKDGICVYLPSLVSAALY